MQYVSVRSVASRLKSQFKIDMDIFDVVQACTDALKKMGSIGLARSIYLAKVSNFCVHLPGVWKVRGVVRLDGIAEPPVTIDVQDIYFPEQLVFTVEETQASTQEAILFKANVVPQLKGPYIGYTWDCPHIRFNETDIPVAIEATNVILDEEKFPKIPEERFYGCLYYALFVYYQPLFLLGQVSPQVMAQVEKWKNDNIAQANASALMAALTTNERDELMNIATSFDRKRFDIPA